MLDGDKYIKLRLKKLGKDAKYLKELRIITNECLSNGAYSISNMEYQFKQFDIKNVPEWEQDIIRKAWEIKRKLAHRIFNELDILLTDIEQKLIFDNNNIIDKDIIKKGEKKIAENKRRNNEIENRKKIQKTA